MRRENGIKDCVITSKGGKLLHEFYFTVLGIVSTVARLIESLGGAVGKLLNKRKSIPLWTKYDIVVSLNMAKTVRKWQNLQKSLIFQQQG